MRKWINLVENKIYYHVTKTENVDSILNNGLLPSIGNRSVKIEKEPMTFLFGSVEDAEDAMMNWLGDEMGDSPCSLLKINTNAKLTKNGFEYFTKGVIPPENISIEIKEF